MKTRIYATPAVKGLSRILCVISRWILRFGFPVFRFQMIFQLKMNEKYKLTFHQVRVINDNSSHLVGILRKPVLLLISGLLSTSASDNASIRAEVKAVSKNTSSRVAWPFKLRCLVMPHMAYFEYNHLNKNGIIHQNKLSLNTLYFCVIFIYLEVWITMKILENTKK